LSKEEYAPQTVLGLWDLNGNIIKKDDPKKKKKKKDGEESELDEELIPLPTKDPGFEKFCRYITYPKFRGLFKWQKEHHDLTWESTFEETLVPRNHGKSIEYAWKYEWAMWYQNYDVLLLGWTDRRKEIAYTVYVFFERQRLVEKDKRTSPFHFRLVNGGKFDCYLITSKDTLGMHSLGRQDRFENMSNEDWDDFVKMFEDNEDGAFDPKEIKRYVEEQRKIERKLWISVDDPIDSKFMKERHLEETLELHFNSSLYPIHPDKWSFTGTHKFEGDFFDFIGEKFGKDLVVYKRKTRNEDGSLLCPELFTHPSLPSFEKDLKKKKINLEATRKHVGEYAWFSEYEQDPHPITGEIWDHIKTINLLEDPVNRKYDICFITIDRATTTKQSSSYTGCVIGLRNMNTGHKVILHDWTEHTTLEELLIKINDFVIEFKKKYESIRIIIIIEKQGGGDDFIEMCRSRVYFIHDGKQITNKIAIYAEIMDLHNTGEKIQRIKDRLLLPIKNELISMMSTLERSELANEILKFPYYPKLDAIDALANAEYELQKIPVALSEDPFVEIMSVYADFEDNLTHRNIKTPEDKEEEIRRQLRRGKSRVVIDDW